MAITLDGTVYKTLPDGYKPDDIKVINEDISITGAVVHLESGIILRSVTLNLRCSPAEMATLITSYKKVTTTGTPPGNLLTFIDEEGVTWSAASGADDSTHKYSTGVFFNSMSRVPIDKVNWSRVKYFNITITLTINAKMIP